MPKSDILSFSYEFARNGETCHVLMRMSEIGLNALQNEMKNNPHTEIVGYYVNDLLVGMARFTKEPTYEANGKFGYAIRPNLRGQGYAVQFVEMASQYAFQLGINCITACVDSTNGASMAVLTKCGYKASGRQFWWLPDPEPRLALEFVRKAVCANGKV